MGCQVDPNFARAVFAHIPAGSMQNVSIIVDEREEEIEV
jgi:hypothetical protein